MKMEQKPTLTEIPGLGIYVSVGLGATFYFLELVSTRGQRTTHKCLNLVFMPELAYTQLSIKTRTRFGNLTKKDQLKKHQDPRPNPFQDIGLGSF
ncbi:hypothetical protein AYR62_08875 [Secundilactobacillus paracollinoides]|uniref:Uncharacterized protein n=1 Tax=Secundilactobacillus paracollinoides TaxID=240427 RepID=A0A1B2IZC0_9LACO|nr:hypothetical protein AYR62_08875 [Secundilactobacillus paracollinoides]ANZ67358.1 hypothetical protein AYR63_09500 [Secundilactobacillus paracollinoides]